MKYVNRIAVMTRMSIAGILVGLSVPFLAGNEPNDIESAALSIQILGQKTVAPSESWAEADTPASALLPSIGPSRISADGTKWDESRLFCRTRNDAIAGLHEEYRTGFAWVPPSFANRGMPSHLRSMLRGDYKNWYIIELSSGVRIEPTSRFGNDEFPYEIIKETLSNSCDSRPFHLVDMPNDEEGSVTKSDADRTRGDFDSSIRLLQACNEEVSITEWKLSRLELTGRKKLASFDCYAAHSLNAINDVRSKPKVPTASSTTLSGFEQRALEQFQSHPVDDVVISETDDELQVVGALRVERRCLRCHTVERGELLGGLTYRFTRVD